jgi:hypothetical protein
MDRSASVPCKLADSRGLFSPLRPHSIKQQVSLYADDVVIFLSLVVLDLVMTRVILDLFRQALRLALEENIKENLLHRLTRKATGKKSPLVSFRSGAMEELLQEARGPPQSCCQSCCRGPAQRPRACRAAASGAGPLLLFHLRRSGPRWLSRPRSAGGRPVRRRLNRGKCRGGIEAWEREEAGAARRGGRAGKESRGGRQPAPRRRHHRKAIEIRSSIRQFLRPCLDWKLYSSGLVPPPWIKLA